MQKIFMNRKNSKTNESHKFAFSLSQRLNLRSLNKHVALQNLSIASEKIPDSRTKTIYSK